MSEKEPVQTEARRSALSPFTIPTDEFEDITLTRTRRTIGDHVTRSLKTAAQLTSSIEVDVTELMRARESEKRGFQAVTGASLSPFPFFALAAVEALRAFPEFNSHALDDSRTVRLFRDVNLGIAVGRDEGLIVPVIRNANELSFVKLALAINDVGARARAKGGLTLDDVTGGTFTVTNYGSFGALTDTPIIALPQVAILGVGSIEKRPSVVSRGSKEEIEVRSLAFLNLTYDHRWIDGHRAAQFNVFVKRALARSVEEWRTLIGIHDLR